MQGGLSGPSPSTNASKVFRVLVMVPGCALIRVGRSLHRWAWLWGGLLGVGVPSAFLSTQPRLGVTKVRSWIALHLPYWFPSREGVFRTLTSHPFTTTTDRTVPGDLALRVSLGLAFPDLIPPKLGHTDMNLEPRAVQGFVRLRFWRDGL